MRTEQDPIDNTKRDLLAGNHITEEGLKDLDKEVKAIVSEAAEFAQTSPEPPESDLLTDIFVA